MLNTRALNKLCLGNGVTMLYKKVASDPYQAETGTRLMLLQIITS
jgi:hypothetical protein